MMLEAFNKVSKATRWNVKVMTGAERIPLDFQRDYWTTLFATKNPLCESENALISFQRVDRGCFDTVNLHGCPFLYLLHVGD